MCEICAYAFAKYISDICYFEIFPFLFCLSELAFGIILGIHYLG